MKAFDDISIVTSWYGTQMSVMFEAISALETKLNKLQFDLGKPDSGKKVVRNGVIMNNDLLPICEPAVLKEVKSTEKK